MPTVGSLFSGLGGFDLAFERAGFRLAWSCESDQDARRVLARHWPAVPCYPDVREMRGADVEPVDVLVGGWPCQDLSVAGGRAGLAGARSGLFHEIPRLVREMREATDGRYPRFVVGENVPGLLSSADGADFGTVLSALGHVGALDIGWRVLDAQWFGVPQRRRRVFIVADFGGRRAAEVLALADGLRRHPAPRREAEEYVAGTIGVGSKGSGPHGLDTAGAFVVATREVAAALTATSGKQPDNSDTALGPNLVIGFDWQSGGDVRHNITVDGTPARQASQVPAVLMTAISTTGHQGDRAVDAAGIWPTLLAQNCGNGGGAGALLLPPAGARVRRLMPVECERLQGVPDGWTDELTDTARYRCLGNAVAVPVVEWIAGRVADALEADRD